jgi:ABC-2 type transport system permease protein
MSAALAIARRELASFFRIPLGWIVTALFLFLSAIAFFQHSLEPGRAATLQEFFTMWWSLLSVIAPAISMRLLAEETRAGTIEPLMSSPASEVAIAAGKYLGAVAFLVLCLAPTLVFPGVLLSLSRPDVGPIIAGYLGMILLGMAYLAVGLLFSALTSSQTLAFLGTILTLILLERGATEAAAYLPEPWDSVASALSMGVRLADFAKGLIDTRHIVFFLGVSAWFVLMAALVLRIRRWR